MLRVVTVAVLLFCFSKFCESQFECPPNKWHASDDATDEKCKRDVEDLCYSSKVKWLTDGLLGDRSVYNTWGCTKACPDDSRLVSDWYRIPGFYDNSIPESCPVNLNHPEITKCGRAVYPTYLTRVNEEKRAKELVWTAHTCFTSAHNTCCNNTKLDEMNLVLNNTQKGVLNYDTTTGRKILMFHCNYDILYYLTALNSSDYRYCTASRSRCQYRYKSDSGFEPCVADIQVPLVSNSSIDIENSRKTVNGAPLLSRSDPPGGLTRLSIFVIVASACSLTVLTILAIMVMTCWSIEQKSDRPVALATTGSNSALPILSASDDSPNRSPYDNFVTETRPTRRRDRDIVWADDDPNYKKPGAEDTEANGDLYEEVAETREASPTFQSPNHFQFANFSDSVEDRG